MNSFLRKHLLPIALLALFTGALLWPLLLGRTLYWGDLLLYFLPMHEFGRERLLQGRLPLWNPLIYNGLPYWGIPQIGLFYPATALLPLLSTPRYISLVTGLHLFLAGAFTYFYLFYKLQRTGPALAGGLIYAGSSALVGRLQFPPMALTAAYLPLLLLCVDYAVERPRALTSAGFALTVALAVLAGHPHTAYLILLSATLYALARLWQQRQILDPHRGWQWPAIVLFGGGLLGLALTAAQTLPAVQLLQESVREEMTIKEADRFYFPPYFLLTLLAPRFFGHPASADYWARGNAWEAAIFIGWLPLFLAGYALVKHRAWDAVRFWGFLALLTFWLAMGRLGGLYWLAFYALPGLAKFHDPARFLILTTFALAALAAYGFLALMQTPLLRRSRFVGAALTGIALPLWWYGQDWNPALPPEAISPPKAIQSRVRAALAGPGRLYLPEHATVWRRYISRGYNDYHLGPAAQTARALYATLFPNVTMNLGLRTFTGYEPVAIQAVVTFEEQAHLALERSEPNTLTLLALANADILLVPKQYRLAAPGLRRLPAHPDLPELAVYRRGTASPPTWIAREIRRVQGLWRVEAALTAPDFDPAKTAIVSTEPEVGREAPHSELEALEWGGNPSNETPTAPIPSRVTIEATTDTQMILRADAGQLPGFLVSSMTAYPGWKATRNGQPARLYRTNGVLLGLALPPGEHTVRLRYAPDTVRCGLYLSLLSAGALSCLATVGLLRRGAAGNHAGKSA